MRGGVACHGCVTACALDAAGGSVEMAEEVVGALQGSPLMRDEEGARGTEESALLPVEATAEVLDGLLQVGWCYVIRQTHHSLIASRVTDARLYD
jgi:hypothetical protein